jgi:hypothetical protein
MSNLAVAASVAPAVETLSVPVPRTSAVVEVWTEFALALGIGVRQINEILRKGLENFLLESASMLFLNGRGEVVFTLKMVMDWQKHKTMSEFEHNLDLCPQQPFTEQLHSNFQRLLVYLRGSKAAQGIARTELHVRFRQEIYDNPELLERARAFLNLAPVAPIKYAPGVRQPDMTFRFAPIPETTFVVREIWPTT